VQTKTAFCLHYIIKVDIHDTGRKGDASDALRRIVRMTGLFTAEINEFAHPVNGVTVNNPVLHVRSPAPEFWTFVFADEMCNPNLMTSSPLTGALTLRFLALLQKARTRRERYRLKFHICGSHAP